MMQVKEFATVRFIAALIVSASPPFAFVANATGQLHNQHEGGDDKLSRQQLSEIAAQPVTFSQGFVPYWYTDTNTPAILDIVNRDQAGRERTVELVAYLNGNERVSLGAVTLPWATLQHISITDRLRDRGLLDNKQSGTRWGTGERPGSAWGSLIIEGHGRNDLSAWMLMTNDTESLANNVVMATADQAATNFITQWWAPTEDTTVSVAIQNTSNDSATINVTLDIDGDTHVNTLATLAAGQAHRLDLDALANKLGIANLPDSGHLTVSADQPLIVRAFAADPQTGFSTPLMAHNPENRTGNDLQTPGAPLGAVDDFPTGTIFHPTLILTNTSDQSTDVDVFLQGEIPGSYQPTGYVVERNGRRFERLIEEDGTVEFPISDWAQRLATTVQLEPGETRTIDLFEHAISEIVSQQVGVRVVTNDAPAGTLIADLIVVDESLTYSFFDPMFDTSIERPHHFAISFDISGPKNAHMLIKNTADMAGGFNYAIYYAGPDGNPAEYYGGAPLAAQELAVVDIERIRDLRIPSLHGDLLPIDLEQGFVTIRTSSHVITGDPTFDVENGTCRSCTDQNPGPKRQVFVVARYLLDVCLFHPPTNTLDCAYNRIAGPPCAFPVEFWTVRGGDPVPTCLKRGYIVEHCPATGDRCFPDSTAPLGPCSP